MAEHIIKLEDISKSFQSNNGVQNILRDISLSIPQGQRVAIVGPNGSGKTTLLRIILGITDVDSGKLRTDFSRLLKEVAYIPQDYRNALFPWLRIETNLALHLNESTNKQSLNASLQKPILENFHSYAAPFGFDPPLSKYPYQLSGGEQQLLVIFQSLLKKPKLLVADEPFSAVDAHKRKIMLEFFSDWLDANEPTFLIVSHDFEDALFLADRVIVLSRDSGRIQADIPVEKERPRKLSWQKEKEFEQLLGYILETFEK